MRYLCVICAFLFLGAQTTTNDIKFEHPERNLSVNGQFKLEWSSTDDPGNREYELELARNVDFTDTRQVYKGADHQHYVSGLRNGNYYYRVRIVDADNPDLKNWSEPFHLIVEHQSLVLAGSLFVLGLIVSIATAVVIIRGNRAHRKENNV